MMSNQNSGQGMIAVLPWTKMLSGSDHVLPCSAQAAWGIKPRASCQLSYLLSSGSFLFQYSLHQCLLLPKPTFLNSGSLLTPKELFLTSFSYNYPDIDMYYVFGCMFYVTVLST